MEQGRGGGGGGHNRRSTEEQIAMAINESLRETGAGAADPAAGGGAELEESGEWACLQCTFLNPGASARCAMCLAPAPVRDGGMASPQMAQGGGQPVSMFAQHPSQAPPPAPMQPPKETNVPQRRGDSHRRMTTEEQINLAINQSMEKGMEEAQQPRPAQPQAAPQKTHRRMTTEEQIQRAISMSTDESAPAQPAKAAPKSHRRMTTEEQIQRAIEMSGDVDEDAPPPVPQKKHRRMTTEEQIQRAIEMSNDGDEPPQQEDFSFGAGGDKPKQEQGYAQANQYVEEQPQSAGEVYIQDILEYPENYAVDYQPPPNLPMSADCRMVISSLIKGLNERKQEINKLRIQLNQERLLNQDLRYELEMTFEKCTRLEQQLSATMQQQSATMASNQAPEETFETADDPDSGKVEPEPENKRVHNREPSYGGIRELFADEDGGDGDDSPAEPAAAPAGGQHRAREPSYGGIREMFQEEDDGGKAADEPATLGIPEKNSHAREPSYGGIMDIFMDEDKEDGNTEQKEDFMSVPQGSHRAREPSYGGIREMFSNDDDGGDVDQNQETFAAAPEAGGKKHRAREPSYGGIREMFADDDDSAESDKGGPAPPAEDAMEIQETFEAEIRSSHEVIWNLLVEKVHHPEKYLPVEDVAVEHRDGKWIRHMYLSPMELVITEEITVDEQKRKICFVDTNYPDLEIVNELSTTNDPEVQRVVFYKQNSDTLEKISNPQLLQLFKTDVHFLKQRAAIKMRRAVHAREPSYGQVQDYVVETTAEHHREVSYGGVTEQFEFGGAGGAADFAAAPAPAAAPPQRGGHSRDLSYGGLREKFEEENDPPELMAKLQEEVFRVMDVNEWSKITKGMVVEEVQRSLSITLKPYHKRFIKITIMRIIDGKLKLECFAGEALKNDVIQAETQHKRDISYGGVQAAADYDGDDGQANADFTELDNIFARVENSSSAANLNGGGFDAGPNLEMKSKEDREQEKEQVRKTRRHSRNVSYGGVRELDVNPQAEDDGDDGDELNVVRVTKTGDGSSQRYLQGGGYTSSGKMAELEAENKNLKEKVNTLETEVENMRTSKMMLVECTAQEMERLRGIIASM